MEEWKDIIGYEGLYEVSSLGRVKSLNYRRSGNNKLLKGYLIRGHTHIGIYKGKKMEGYTISRLVAINFIPNPLNLPCACHKDETLDETGALYNGMDNLFWGTQSDNMKDMWKKGRANNSLQLRNPRHNLGKLGKDSHLSKTVIQYSLEGEFIREWASGSDIERGLLIDQSSISRCCRGIQKTAGGFKWKYKNKNTGLVVYEE